jgi:hypothetical protein
MPMRSLLGACALLASLAPAAAQDAFLTADDIRRDWFDRPVFGAMTQPDGTGISNWYREIWTTDGRYVGRYLDGEKSHYDGVHRFTRFPYADAICFDSPDLDEECFAMRRKGGIVEFFNEKGGFAGIATLTPLDGPKQ